MSYEDGESGESTKLSKYNSALAQLYRLDHLWQDTHRHARDILYGKWNEDLDRIWLELVADSEQNEKVRIKIINRKLSKLGLYSMGKKFYLANPSLYNKILLLQKQALIKKEELIRVVQNKQGKGTAYQDDFENYMD